MNLFFEFRNVKYPVLNFGRGVFREIRRGGVGTLIFFKNFVEWFSLGVVVIRCLNSKEIFGNMKSFLLYCGQIRQNGNKKEKSNPAKN